MKRLGGKVAETSGFATDLPQSAYLAHTIRRAVSAAQQRSHRYITLEHLLLALLDDPDAITLFEAAHTDISGLRAGLIETITHNLATLYAPGTFDLRASYKVERVLQSASDDARRIGCVEVDGAFVAVALFHETDSLAGALLKRHNFTFHAAMTWIYRNRGAPPPPRQSAAPEPAAEPEAEPEQLAPEPQAEAEAQPEVLVEEVIEGASGDDAVIEEDEEAAPEAEQVAAPSRAGQAAWAPRPAEPASRAPRPVFPQPAAMRAEHAMRVEPSLRPDPAPPAQPPMRRQAGIRAEPVLRADAAMRAEPASRAEPPIRLEPPVRAEPAIRLEPSAQAAPPVRLEQRADGWSQPDLGAAVPARDLAPRPSRDEEERAPDTTWQEHIRRAERRSLAGSLENVKVEPGFPDPAANAAGAIYSRARPASAAEPEPGERIAGPAPAAASPAPPQPNGTEPRPSHTVSARDPSAPILPSEPKLRAPQPHASARDRGIEEGRGPENSFTLEESGPGRSAGPRGGRLPADAAGPTRSEPTVPPLRRLEDMRLRPPTPPEPPPPPRTGQRKPGQAAKEADRQSRSRRKPQGAATVFAGKIAENIPRKMCAFVAERVEVRISREDGEAFMSGFEGRAEPLRHDIVVTQAMSVVLRAPDGGFTIENLGPETQWIFNRPSPGERDGFGRWRWSVTPTETGEHRLQLVVSSRTVDQNGLAGDTALPDQVITVKVRSNYRRGFVNAVKWVSILVLGGMITEAALYVLRLTGAMQ